MKNKDLAVVCCYFNPCGYLSKYENFRKFYARIKPQVPRVCVIELESPLKLPPEINTRLVSSNSVLWHKENLLNIGIDQLLKEGYKNIAWLDGDIIFQDGFWAKDAVDCLKKYKLCQLFSKANRIQSNGEETFHPGCVRYWRETGNIYPINTFYHTGYGWAARAECLEACRLYDKGVLGGGDSLIWFGAFNGPVNTYELLQNHPIVKLDLNAYIIDYLNWSEKWGSVINGEVSYIFNNITSLPHGVNKNKHYISRYKYLAKNNYSPMRDISYNQGILECSNPELEKSILKYFKSRKEDGGSFWYKVTQFIEKTIIAREVDQANKSLNKNL